MPGTNLNQDALNALNKQVAPNTQQLDAYSKKIKDLVSEMQKAGASVKQIEVEVSQTAEEFLSSWIKKQEVALTEAKKRQKITKEETRDLETLLTLQVSSQRQLNTLQQQIAVISKDTADSNKAALADLQEQSKKVNDIINGIDISKKLGSIFSLEGPTKALTQFQSAVKAAMLEPFKSQQDAQQKAVDAATKALSDLQDQRDEIREQLQDARALGDTTLIQQLNSQQQSLLAQITKQQEEVAKQQDLLNGATQIYDAESARINSADITAADVGRFGVTGEAGELLRQLIEVQQAEKEKSAREDSRNVRKQYLQLQRTFAENEKDKLKKQKQEGSISNKEYQSEIRKLNKTISELNKTEEDILEEEKAEQPKQRQETQSLKQAIEVFKEKFNPEELKKALYSAANQAFEQAESILNRWQGTINTRLEGSGRDYKSVTNNVSSSLMFSGLVKQQDVMNNLGELVKSGIAYNVEQRAFLQTVASDIDSTFNAFDANLLRLVRLQREDSSYARMGLETTLNRLLNQEFLDSSYMNDMYDSIQGALIDVSSQLSTQESAKFDYTINKWLGAMYSMGAGSSFVQSIASGLNMLGTGNVQGLAGSPMQTLLAQASNRAGLDYAKLLTEGLDSSNTNELMKAMVEYLAEIADANKDNRVVAGAYSSLYGMTIADMTAIRNLAGDISSTYENAIANIYGSSLSYEQMAGVTESRLSTLAGNYSVGKRIENLFSNILYSTVDDIVQNPAMYMTYKAADFLQGQGIDPTINLGFLGTGTSFRALDTIKLGVMGISLLGNALGSLGKSSTKTSLTNWIDEGEMRGNAYDLTAKSSVSSSMVANASSEDVESKSLQEGAASAKKKQKTVQGKDANEEELDTDALFYGLFAQNNKEGALSAVNVTSQALLQLLTKQATEDGTAQKVTIVGFDIGGTDEFELPVRLGKKGNEQADTKLAYLLGMLKGTDTATIDNLIALLEGSLAENDSFNVNVLSADLEVIDWLKGKGTSDTKFSDYSGRDRRESRLVPRPERSMTGPGSSKSVGRPVDMLY